MCFSLALVTPVICVPRGNSLGTPPPSKKKDGYLDGIFSRLVLEAI